MIATPPTLVDAAAAVALPLAILFIPGIAAVTSKAPVLEKLARILLWSISATIITTAAAAWFGFEGWTWLLVTIAVSLLVLMRAFPYQTWQRITVWWTTLAIAALFCALYLALSIPFLTYHEGLPTGDSQKAIFWAQKIASDNNFPDYAQAIARLNRDPSDFYTPGLHALTAVFIDILPTIYLTSVGLLTIACSIALVIITMAISYTITERTKRRAAVILTGLFLLTNIRFLRYVREPGYHMQNVVGELLLFGMLYISLQLMRRWRWADAVLLAMLGSTLVITHQFSAFLAVPLMAAWAAGWLISRPSLIYTMWRAHQLRVMAALAVLIVLAGIALAAGIAEKIPHIFTRSAHLATFLPALEDYPRIIGDMWLILGIGGWAALVWPHQKSTRSVQRHAFVAATATLFALSQAPRFGIDIPPARALLYSVVPICIGAGYVGSIIMRLSGAARIIAFAGIALPMALSAQQALTISHSIRTNATLQPAHLAIMDIVRNRSKTSNEAVLVDAYNQQGSTWLLLTGQPTFTRLADSLETIMNEADQSPLRKQLYLNHVDYEKIYSLGNLPEIAVLLEKHRIRWVFAAESSADSFRANPYLYAVAETAAGTLFEIASDTTTQSGGLNKDTRQWLLRASTLANDIGDLEDTFKHLPISLRATRLSLPYRESTITYRVTTAPIIPLEINAGDYTRYVWDKDKDGYLDTNAELLIVTAAPAPHLTVHTPLGTVIPITPGKPTSVAPHTIPINESGFITLFIENPSQSPLAIDLIAFGLARIP